MIEYMKIAVYILIGLLLISCAKRQRRYWREMTTNRPTGSLRAGYILATITIVLGLATALLVNTPQGWQMFIGVAMLTLVFCVKITFSPVVIAVILVACGYQLYAYDRFPLFELWGGTISVLAWRLPEQFRIVYSTLSFIWVLMVFFRGGSPAISSAEDIADVAGTVS
jgi:hypothetical protein